MIQDTFYTIVLIFYGWILFLEFITFLLGDSFLVLVLYAVMTLYESTLYYLRYTNPTQQKKYQFYSNIIMLLVSIDLLFHTFCWFLLNPLQSNLGERAVLPLMILSDATRLYYEVILGQNGEQNFSQQQGDFSVLIGT